MQLAQQKEKESKKAKQQAKQTKLESKFSELMETFSVTLNNKQFTQALESRAQLKELGAEPNM